MNYVIWGLRITFALIVALFLDYTLPHRDTVRVVEASTRLTPIGWNAIFYASEDTGTVQHSSGQRDIRFIDTIRPNGKPLVFRNEDTGLIWPPYFKYDSANLQAVASDMKSSSGNPSWVSVSSYGWRVSWASVYPNAIAIRPVAGPDERPMNWPRLVMLGLIGLFLLLIWRMWAQFRERMIDPAIDDLDAAWDRVDARADAARDRVGAQVTQTRGWLRRWLNRGRS